MRRRPGIVVVVVSAALALTGCSEKSSTASEACGSAGAATGSAAPRTVGGPTAGYTLALPGSWTQINIDQNAIGTLFSGNKLTHLQQALQDQVRLLAGRGGKLFAFDPAHCTTNVNVLQQPPTPGLTLDSLAQGLPAQLNQAHLENVKVDRVNLTSGPAVRAVGTQSGATIGKDAKNLFQIQYYAFSGADVYITVLATDDPARYQTTLNTIGQSFAVTKK